MLKRVFLILPFFVMSFALNAHAQQDQTSTLQTALQNIFQKYKFTTEGQPLIEPAQDYYAITLPGLKHTNEEFESIDFGLVSANVSSDTNQNLWKSAIALPTSISQKNADNIKTKEISFGSQNITGIWDTQNTTFKKLKAALGNIKLIWNSADINADIESINIHHDLATTVSLANLNLKSTDEATALLNLKDVFLNFELQDELVIKESFLESEEYRLDFSGKLIPNPEKIFGVEGELLIELRGMEYILSLMQVLAANPNSPKSKEYRAISAGLEKLKSVGQIKIDEEGFVHKYALTTDETGNILINGQSAVALFLLGE